MKAVCLPDAFSCCGCKGITRCTFWYALHVVIETKSFEGLGHEGVKARDELNRSYQWCYRVSRRSGSNFYRAFGLLDRPQRQAMYALYAFARTTDDLGDDGDLSPEQLQHRTLRMKAWEKLVLEQLGPHAPGIEVPASQTIPMPEVINELAPFDSLWPALRHAVEQFAIPPHLLHDLVIGVQMDIGKVRLADWQAVDTYSYHVASTVGLACTRIWQARDTLSKQHAVDCGLAFQLTNILRDLREDASRNRIYLPTSELERFGCSTDAWLSGHPNGDWQGLVKVAIARARQLFDSGAHTISHLPKNGARMFWLMWRTYRELLESIDRNQHLLWTGPRPRVRRITRAWLLWKMLVSTPTEANMRLGR